MPADQSVTPETTPPTPAVEPVGAVAPGRGSFVRHAKLISVLTLLSRFFGLAREDGPGMAETEVDNG